MLSQEGEGLWKLEENPLMRDQGRCRLEYEESSLCQLAHYAIERLSKCLGREKAIIVSKYCSFPREFPMTVLPEHLGNMNTQRRMTLVIKLVLVSQDKSSMKEQMSA